MCIRDRHASRAVAASHTSLRLATLLYSGQMLSCCASGTSACNPPRSAARHTCTHEFMVYYTNECPGGSQCEPMGETLPPTAAKGADIQIEKIKARYSSIGLQGTEGRCCAPITTSTLFATPQTCWLLCAVKAASLASSLASPQRLCDPGTPTLCSMPGSALATSAVVGASRQ